MIGESNQDANASGTDCPASSWLTYGEILGLAAPDACAGLGQWVSKVYRTVEVWLENAQNAPVNRRVILGRYELLHPLGAGGSATTFAAFDRIANQSVALKLLHPETPELADAIRLEFDLLRSLRHPNLTPVFDFARSTADGHLLCLLTSELVDGVPLHRSVRSFRDVRRPLADVLAALAALHAAGYRHGDVKADNILVRPDGSAVLIDLGCARRFGPIGDVVCGSPDHLAPELRSGQRADARADLFALGITLRLLSTSLRKRPDHRLVELIDRLTESQPSDRPAAAIDVLPMIGVRDAFLAGEPVPDRFVGREASIALAARVLDGLRANEPGPRCLLLRGRPGSGKSRLLREIKWMAQRDGLVFETDPSRRGAIPELLAWASDTAIPPEDIAAVVSTGERLSERGYPTVLVVDDIHRLADHQARLLLALVRSLLPSGSLLVVAATARDEAIALTRNTHVETVGPLDASALRSWLPDLSSAGCSRLLAATGGYPAHVRARVASAGNAGELERALVAGQGPAVSSMGDVRLDESEAAVLALLCASPDPVRADRLRELGAFEEVAVELARRGWIEPDGASWKLACAGERGSIERAVGQRYLERAHVELASWCQQRLAQPDTSQPERSFWNARHVGHLVGGNRVSEAEELFVAFASEAHLAPAAWAAAASLLADRSSRGDVAAAVIAIERGAGFAVRAAERARSLLDSASASASACDRVRLELAECLRVTGELDEAVAVLESLWRDARNAAVAVSMSRCQLKRGAYGDALTWARRGLELAQDPEVRVDALVSAGLACSYQGRPGEARSLLEDAAGLVDGADGRRVVRVEGARGLAAFHAGELAIARESYARVLAVAEEAGAVDQVATAALNLGTALHQGGEHEAALRAYERGWRVALGLGQATTCAVLQFDMAKAWVDLGQNDRAIKAAEECERLAVAAGVPMLGPACATVRAEVSLVRGDGERARVLLEGARAEFERDGSVREHAEVLIQLADVELSSGRSERARVHADAAERVLGQDAALDVRLRVGLIRARAGLLEGRVREVIELLEGVQSDAAKAGLFELHAEMDGVLSAAWSKLASTVLSDKHRNRAAEHWERMAVRLPDSERDAFRRHPRRRDVFDAKPVQGREPGEARGRLEHLVELAKRVNSSLELSKVLSRAMDAAIELTGAERGFVLLAADDGGGLEVAASRNVDRRQLEGEAPLAFSRSIAERVVATDVPVVTADAQVDPRFRTEASVHAMHLRSVVCLPIRSPEAVLGALYLDNRLSRGRFGESDLFVLRAFADHVAVALTNARLHQELQRRTEELAEQKRAVEALARGQAERIDRLEEQVRDSVAGRVHEYPYTDIVGTSAPMRSMFDLLDRVVGSMLPVLIEGESGTGKELVAKAIHAHGPRMGGPWVAINCAAVPEGLLESELFGHEKGAFTGADRARIGLVQQAQRGTLFLDEIGEMPPSTQVKLLRVLQEREVRPLGSKKSVRVDFRLVSATNRRLGEQVELGQFRQDLYYRIAVVVVKVPSLRERLSDLPMLVERIRGRLEQQTGKPVPPLTGQAMRRLSEHAWPGNVRQLENVIARAAVICSTDRIRAVDLELEPSAGVGCSNTRADYRERERERILTALEDNRWNVSRASRLLGIPRPTLYRRMRELGADRSRGSK